MLNHFYRERLTPEEQVAYDIVLAGAEAYEREIHYPRTQDPFRVLTAVNYDNPQLFYVNWVETMKISAFAGEVIWCPPYLYHEAEARELRAQMDALAESLPGISAEGRVEQIHDWFVRHIQYDREGLSRPVRSPSMFNAVGPLLHRSAVCEGVSKLACYLMRRKHLEASIVVGRAEDGGLHAWNAVSIRGTVMYLDITYDIGMSRNHYISRRYLLISQAEMAKDHTITLL